ncbi:hypothetical protein OFO12_05815 [Campylobacter sp. JMF_04 NA10]|nr:hypothetical protein [Campylobacter sp. JMF_04 NA10]MDA3076885.1 hypothetical protein [Campylobacter sp. JMF_04 NA10]
MGKMYDVEENEKLFKKAKQTADFAEKFSKNPAAKLPQIASKLRFIAITD